MAIMVDEKDASHVVDQCVTPDGECEALDESKGTAEDRADMERMGKTQELQRNFHFVSMLAFTLNNMASWETSLIIAGTGLVNGGTAGFIWVSFIGWIGFLVINTSMAEMASMAPTSGGQYHWISEFAPKQYQKFMSYVMGWLCVLGWQSGGASTAFMSGTMIQGLIVLNNPSYTPQGWHGTLLAIAVAAFSVFFNTFLAKKLPLIESCILAIHLCAFVGILITLWVLMSPSSTAAATSTAVFTHFSDGGGWGSLGGSTLVGLTAGIFPLLGADSAVHMSEELQGASRTIPRSMIWTTVLNGMLACVMVITFAFSIQSSNVDAVLASPTGYPFMAVFENITQSTAAATAMAIWVIVMTICSNLTIVATASRQLYAFSRDNGLPFSRWFCTVTPGTDIPLRAIIFTFMTASLLSLINIGSSIALNSVVSLATNAILSSYICSIGCLIWRRLTNSPLLPSPFSLGRWGVVFNICAEIFLVIFFVCSFFPATPNPTAATMNWNILIYFSVVFFALAYYLVRGRHEYVGPVEYVRKLE